MGIFSEISRIEGAEFKAEVDEIVWLITHGSQLMRLLSKNVDSLLLWEVTREWTALFKKSTGVTQVTKTLLITLSFLFRHPRTTHSPCLNYKC